MNDVSDATAAVPGDAAALAAKRAILARLVTEQPHRLARMVRSTVRSSADAEDLAQEIVVRALRGLDGLSGADEPLMCAWLGRVAHTTAINAARARSRDRSEREPDDADLVPAPSAERVALGRLAWRLLVAELDAMPGAYAEVLRLRLIDGLTAPEVARRLGITETAVRTRLHRARARLAAATAPALDGAGGVA